MYHTPVGLSRNTAATWANLTSSLEDICGVSESNRLRLDSPGVDYVPLLWYINNNRRKRWKLTKRIVINVVSVVVSKYVINIYGYSTL